MTIAELAKKIGDFGTIRTENGLEVTVECVDVKQSYGKTRFQVTPCAGAGTAWVESIAWISDPTEAK